MDQSTDIDDGNVSAGNLSLREAVRLSNTASAGLGIADFITFDPIVFATATTITLTGGSLLIGEAVTITGPGAGLLTIDANNLSRHFTVNVPDTSGNPVNIAGMTLTHGQADAGGAILNVDENLTLSGMAVLANKANGNGGGISVTSAEGSLTLRDSTVSDNQAVGTLANGGGINLDSASDVLIERSTISGNKSGEDGGGIYFFWSGSLRLIDSTVSGNLSNVTSGGAGGGGIYFFGNPGANGFVIRNSTISGNTAGTAAIAASGGGVSLPSFNGIAVIQNSTITANAATRGGGVAQSSYGGSLMLSSSIVAGNTAIVAGSDLYLSDSGSVAVNGTHNIVGVADDGGFSLSAGNLSGTTLSPFNPMLGALADNGGPTQTHALLSGSPAIDTGENPVGLEFDQRGPGFDRVSGTAADIGAFEFAQTVSSAAPLFVTGVQVNDGSPQRSVVQSLTVRFSQNVTFPFGVAAAFQLVRTGPSGPTGAVNLAFDATDNAVTLTFEPGGPVGLDKGGSLLDGTYSLTVFADKVQGSSTGGLLADYVSPATGSGSLHRLFGDVDGNRIVDNLDLIAIRQALGTATSVFDSDDNGEVDIVDFIQFRQRIGAIV